jgi:hypothetical protein
MRLSYGWLCHPLVTEAESAYLGIMPQRSSAQAALQ